MAKRETSYTVEPITKYRLMRTVTGDGFGEAKSLTTVVGTFQTQEGAERFAEELQLFEVEGT